MNRRTLLKGLIGAAAAGLAGGFYAWQIEPFWLEFVRMKMPVKNLPAHLAGKTLMQISDLHVGKRFDHKYIIDSFKEARKFNPDFVVYTGDYVSLYKEEVLYDLLKDVLDHAVKGKYATLGILGNHDYGINWQQGDVADKITAMLTNAGVTMLRNEQTSFAELNFIGLDDYWGINFAPQKVMNQFDATRANIVLCHNPDVCDIDIWNNYNSWILAGHTHGGQCKPPFLNPPMLPVKNKKYSAEKFNLSNERILYINRALGHLWQVRFNVRPEITLFELEAV